MESRSKKSGRTPKKSSAKTKGKKKVAEKESDVQDPKIENSISHLKTFINDPQTSILISDFSDEESKEINLRNNLLNILIEDLVTEEKSLDKIEPYSILDDVETVDDYIDSSKQLVFRKCVIPEEFKKFICLSDKKFFLNDNSTNKNQSVESLLRYFIFIQLNKLEFGTVQEQALDILTDVVKSFIERVGFLANSFASIPGNVMKPIDIITKTLLDVYPNGINEVKDYANSLKEKNQMVVEDGEDLENEQSKKPQNALDEKSLKLLQREQYLQNSPFVKKKKKSFMALYKDAYRANSQSISSPQLRVSQVNRQLNHTMNKPFDNSFPKFSTPQSEKRKRSDFEYDDDELSSSRQRRTRSTRGNINYEEYDDEYGDDEDDEGGPKKKKRKSGKR